MNNWYQLSPNFCGFKHLWNKLRYWYYKALQREKKHLNAGLICKGYKNIAAVWKFTKRKITRTTYVIRSPPHAHKLLAPSLVTIDPEGRLLSYAEYFRNEICSCSQFSSTETGYNEQWGVCVQLCSQALLRSSIKIICTASNKKQGSVLVTRTAWVLRWKTAVLQCCSAFFHSTEQWGVCV